MYIQTSQVLILCLDWCLKAKAGTYCEAGDHSVNYADEVPPKWISTSKAEFTHKTVDLERDKIEGGMIVYTLRLQCVKDDRIVANYIRKNHFTLTGPGEPEKNYTSVTQKDYIYTDTHKTTDRKNYKDLIHSYSVRHSRGIGHVGNNPYLWLPTDVPSNLPG
jgi:hypothetical protein